MIIAMKSNWSGQKICIYMYVVLISHQRSLVADGDAEVKP